MVLIRAFEEKIAYVFAEGKIPGFVHTYVGEEAIAVGACANLREDDYITSTHRGHGHCLAKGMDPKYMLAELYGKRTGCNKGKGGSMHIADIDIGVLGACGIVGGGIPIATGAGLSAKLKGTDQVAVCFFGDGASNQGTFHESLNLASVFKLPVIYVCENNLWGEGTPVSETMNIENIADRASAYGIPGVIVDGNDVTAVCEAVREAVKRAREGKGPSLIECKTYRWRYHAEGFPIDEMYVGKEAIEKEHKKWKDRDPIKRFKERLVKMEILTEEEAEKINRNTAKTIEDAVKYAEVSPFPLPEEALEDLYSE